MNKVLMVGRISRDVEVRYTQIGNKMVVTFSVALQKKGKDAGADFINCIAWEKTGEFISKYFKKGSGIGIVGHLNTRSYDDKDGKRVYVTEVVVEEAEFVGSKKDNEEPATEDNGSIYSDDSLPF